MACSGEKKALHSSFRLSVAGIPVCSATSEALPCGFRFCLTLLPKKGTILLWVNSSARTDCPLSVSMRCAVVPLVVAPGWSGGGGAGGDVSRVVAP